MNALIALAASVTRIISLERLDKVRTAARAAATVVAVGAGVAGAVAAVTSTFGRGGDSGSASGWAWLAVVLVPIVVALVIPSLIFALRRMETRQLDLKIGGFSIELGDTPNEEIAKLLEQTAVLSSDSELQRQRIQRHMVDDSSLRREVESRVLGYMPRRPRSMKRAVNHLRLQLALVVTRNVLGGSPPIDTNHVAKWVVFGYRWPSLAAVVTRQTSLMAELEDAVETPDLAEVLNRAGLTGISVDELSEFLTEQPRLAPVLERLVGLRAPAEAA
jgi:hypothetical protein